MFVVFSVSAAAILLSLGIGWYQGDRTPKDYAEILFYVSLAICCVGGLISRGASSGRYPSHGFEEQHHAAAEDLRRLNAENQQAGRSTGLMIFLAGLLPGTVAFLILHYAR